MGIGLAVEAQAELEQAASIYIEVYDKWIPVQGNSGRFSQMLLTAYGSTLRKQGQFNRAAEYLFEAFSSRLRVHSADSHLTVDTALHLAALYRQMSRPSDAAALVKRIECSSCLQDSFERACQLAHIEALLAFDSGNYLSPRTKLMEIVMESSGNNRDRINRELLWIRLNLADALRAHDEADLAPMLFSDLVMATEDVLEVGDASDAESMYYTAEEDVLLGEIIDSPRELAIAETALTVVRDARKTEELLAHEGLEWVREKDFWVISGGPKVDTESLRYKRPNTNLEEPDT